MNECMCKVCLDHRRWMRDINPQTDAAHGALDEILSRLAGAETDAVFWRLKYEGKWGSQSDATEKQP